MKYVIRYEQFFKVEKRLIFYNEEDIKPFRILEK